MTIATMQLQAMFDQPWRCETCDELHHGVPDLSFDAPFYWTSETVIEPNEKVRYAGDFLSADFCVIDGEDYFIRCFMRIPIQGVDADWSYGIWASVSRAHFEQYVDHFHTGFHPPDSPWHGWLANRLKTYPDTLALPCDIHPEGAGNSPRVEITAEDHLLARHIRNGMPAEKLIEILMAYGHVPETPIQKPRRSVWRGFFGRRGAPE